GHDLAPCGRVADAAIERVGPILGGADYVKRRLAAGELAPEAGNARPQQHHAQPGDEPRVEDALEEIEGEGPRRDEEYEDPDRPVVEAVIELVAAPQNALGVELDVQGVRSDVGAAQGNGSWLPGHPKIYSPACHARVCFLS